MYAVIETGGKQYRVEVGTELEVERLEVEPGQAITLERVLLVADGAYTSIGRPLVADAVVSAEVVRQDRGDKVIAFKYRPKARRRIKQGDRQARPSDRNDTHPAHTGACAPEVIRPGRQVDPLRRQARQGQGRLQGRRRLQGSQGEGRGQAGPRRDSQN